MPDPAVGYTSGDDRKADTAGDEMSGPLAWTAADGVNAVEAKVTGDSVDRFAVEVDGTVTWGSGSATRDVNLYRGGADTLKTDDTLHVGASNTIVLGSAGDVTLERTGAGQLTVDGDLVVTGTIAGGDPLDQDLIDIGDLTPSNDDVIQRKAGVWTNRTMAQVKTDLALVKGDVGLGNVTNDAQVTKALLDAKGDLIVASAADTPARLAVGADGYVLTADSAESTGVKWAAASGGSYTAENARDDIATALTEGTGIDITVSDPSDTITVAVDTTTIATKSYVDAADAALQPLDSDLTAIAAISPSNDDIIQRKAGAWTNRTMAQVRTDLGVVQIGSAGTNQYLFPAAPTSTSTSSSISNNSLRLVPWIVRSTLTIIRMGCIVTSSGQASSTFRLGIYSDSGNCYPGSLLLEAGSVATDSTGSPEVTISQQLTPGLYWVGGAHQGAGSSTATFQTITSSWLPPVDIVLGTSAPASGATAYGFQQSSVSGALPSTYTSTVTTTTGAVKVFVKVQ